jgi:hypothetical protein
MNLLHLGIFLFIYQGPFYAPAMFVEKSYIYLKKRHIPANKPDTGNQTKNNKAQH